MTQFYEKSGIMTKQCSPICMCVCTSQGSRISLCSVIKSTASTVNAVVGICRCSGIEDKALVVEELFRGLERNGCTTGLWWASYGPQESLYAE